MRRSHRATNRCITYAHLYTCIHMNTYMCRIVIRAAYTCVAYTCIPGAGPFSAVLHDDRMSVLEEPRLECERPQLHRRRHLQAQARHRHAYMPASLPMCAPQQHMFSPFSIKDASLHNGLSSAPPVVTYYAMYAVQELRHGCCLKAYGVRGKKTVRMTNKRKDRRLRIFICHT